jgi:hypothetical protein
LLPHFLGISPQALPATKRSIGNFHSVPSNNDAQCSRCSSEYRSDFGGELAIHFTGLAGLNKPIVWVFPQLLVCLHCGFTEFVVPARELQVLETGTPVEGAVWLGSREN